MLHCNLLQQVQLTDNQMTVCTCVRLFLTGQLNAVGSPLQPLQGSH